MASQMLLFNVHFTNKICENLPKTSVKVCHNLNVLVAVWKVELFSSIAYKWARAAVGRKIAFALDPVKSVDGYIIVYGMWKCTLAVVNIVICCDQWCGLYMCLYVCIS